MRNTAIKTIKTTISSLSAHSRQNYFKIASVSVLAVLTLCAAMTISSASTDWVLDNVTCVYSDDYRLLCPICHGCQTLWDRAYVVCRSGESPIAYYVTFIKVNAGSYF